MDSPPTAASTAELLGFLFVFLMGLLLDNNNCSLYLFCSSYSRLL